MKWLLLLPALLLGVFWSARMLPKPDVAVHAPVERLDYPVLGLVLPDGGSPVFEPVRPDLEVLQQKEHLRVIRQHGCKGVTHLVLHLDCHYYFANNGMVYVTTWGSPGSPPRLVKARPWAGPPAEFDGYHTQLLPEA
jgi:hypothetical protein